VSAASRPVRDAIRRLTGDSVIYGLGRVAGSLVGLILLPVYTHHLAVAEYGLLDNLFVLAMLMTSIVPLGLPDALQRFWFQADTRRWRKEVVGSAFGGVLVLLAATVPLLVFFAPEILDGLFGDGTQSAAFRWAAVTMVPATVMSLSLAILRSRFRSAAYGLCSVAQVAILGAVNTWLVAGLGLGIRGVFLGGAIAAAATAGLALWFVRRDLSLRPTREMLGGMLAYGAPLVPSFAAFWALSYADRWLLLRMDGLSAVGLYAAGAKIAGVMLVLNFAVLTAFNPVALRLAGRPEAPRFVARSMTAYAAVAAVAAVALSALAPQILGVLTPDAYSRGRIAVPWLTLGFFFAGLTPFLSIGLHIMKKTIWITITAVLAAIANVVLNLILIPRFGLLGAAIATAASYALMALLFHQVTGRKYPVPFETRRLATLCFLLGTALGAVTGMEFIASDSLVPRLAIAVLFPLSLVAARVVRPGEVRGLLRP